MPIGGRPAEANGEIYTGFGSNLRSLTVTIHPSPPRGRGVMFEILLGALEMVKGQS